MNILYLCVLLTSFISCLYLDICLMMYYKDELHD